MNYYYFGDLSWNLIFFGGGGDPEARRNSRNGERAWGEGQKLPSPPRGGDEEKKIRVNVEGVKKFRRLGEPRLARGGDFLGRMRDKIAWEWFFGEI